MTGTELYRAPSVPDLLIAAIAERAGLTLLHQDKDVDLVAEITGQPLAQLLDGSSGGLGAPGKAVTF